MSGPRITLLGSLDQRLRTWLEGHPEGHERGAIVLFRKFDRNNIDFNSSPRFVAIDMIEMDGDWVIESSATHLRINMRNLPPVYLRCEQEGLELGFVHSHPSEFRKFSAQDDQNEQNILRGYAGCNGQHVSLVSLILTDGSWLGRVRTAEHREEALLARHVAVVDDKLSLHLPDSEEESIEVQKRQEAAFGQPFNRKLSSLRIAVIGVGGTGSPAATLLARAGVGEIILIDGDDLDVTNLNRVRGYKMADVGSPKALTLRDYIKSLGLPVSVSAIDEYLYESPEAIDAISGCDAIFGCTDDTCGRDLLNQACYYYGLAFIDAGLTGRIQEDEAGEPFLRDHRGRVSVILPEVGACLRCQNVVTDDKIKFEEALRARPELAELDAETLREEHYLIGGGEQAPGVGPFTSATADFAVSALMDLIKPFRQIDTDLRQDNIWCDFVHLRIHSNEPKDDPDCFCCGSEGLKLSEEGGYRLGMPSFGKYD